MVSVTMGGEWFVLVQVDGDFEQQSAEVTEASPFPLRSPVQIHLLGGGTGIPALLRN